jgi:glycosyltransferase involved in cell wall biosynthesis
VAAAGRGVDESTVRDETALIVAPGDLRGFVTAVERLLDDGELHARLAGQARHWAARRTWPALFERIHDVYVSLSR